jgi:hypothetical protein
MKISVKDLRPLLPLLAAVLLAISCFFGARGALAEAGALRDEAEELLVYAEELSLRARNTELYDGRRMAADALVAAEMSGYPASARPEETIMFMVALENDTGLNAPSLSFSEPRPIGEFEIKDDPDAGSPRLFTAYAAGAAFPFRASYAELKELLGYLRLSKEKTVTESVSVSYDSSDGPTGTGDLFGTLERR